MITRSKIVRAVVPETDTANNERSPVDICDASGANQQNATTSTISGETTANVAPARDVLADLDQLTTKAGLQRIRIKWTTSMNKDVVRCYLKVTDLDRQRIGFRQKLHEMFISLYPSLSTRISEQNIVDRWRTIQKNNLLSPVEIDDLKREIAEEIMPPSQNPQSPSVSIEVPEIHIQPEEDETNVHVDELPNVPTVNEGGQNDTLQLDNTLQHSIFRFSLTNPNTRNRIPKPYLNYYLFNAINKLNNSLLKYTQPDMDLEQIQTLLYSAANTICSYVGCSTTAKDSNNKQIRTKPAWEYRLEKKIANLRGEVGRLNQYKINKRGKRLIKNIKRIINPISINQLTDQKLTEIKDTLQQRLSALSKRLRKYKMCAERKRSNKLFKNNMKLFFRKLDEENLHHERTGENVCSLTKKEIEDFWEKIWSNTGNHEENVLDAVKLKLRNLNYMSKVHITETDVKRSLAKASNWKAPGPDNLQNFWYKKFTTMHPLIATAFNNIIQYPETAPEFLTRGKTFLLPKDKTQLNNPAKYRPITCLNNIYKLLTSILTEKIYQHCESYNLLNIEQIGCRRETQGCKEHVVIDSIIFNQAMKGQRNISAAYIDYKKAFDSIPHSYLIDVMTTYKIDHQIIELLKHLMKQWKTSLFYTKGSKQIQTKEICIRKGIYQGDSLSPLWFCLSLNPLSSILNDTKHGFQIKGLTENYTINHLLYMDDIKLYAKSRTQLHQLLEITANFSSKIRMEFGIDKCKAVNLEKGKLTVAEPYSLVGDYIEDLTENELYKYLGFLQLRGISHTNIKLNLKDKFYYRVKQILETMLSGANIVHAINSYAIPSLLFSFGVVKWSTTDLESIERKVRTLFTQHRMHHPKSAKERITLPCEEGGRGMLNIFELYNSQILNLRRYFLNNTSHLLHNVCLSADQNYTPLNLHSEAEPTINGQTNDDRIESWKTKEMHSTYFYHLNQNAVDKPMSTSWLKNDTIFPETVGFMCAIQDRVIPTRNYRRYILQENITDDSCRKCGLTKETIEHVIDGCSMLASTDYTTRHNNVAKIVHQALALKYRLVENMTPYYKYLPSAILESDTVKLYWDRPILTDNRIAANRPDIVLILKSSKKCYLIDIAVPLSNNAVKSFATKINKYQELAWEIKEMWHLQTAVILPIVVSATGIVIKHSTKNLEELKIHHCLKQIVKSITLDTCHIVRRFLN